MWTATELKMGTDYSGVGTPEWAAAMLQAALLETGSNVRFTAVHACDKALAAGLPQPQIYTHVHTF